MSESKTNSTEKKPREWWIIERINFSASFAYRTLKGAKECNIEGEPIHVVEAKWRDIAHRLATAVACPNPVEKCSLCSSTILDYKKLEGE